MRALLRSPLLHFLLLGTLVYAAQAFDRPPQDDDVVDRRIEIEPSVVSALEDRFAETVGRRPNREERDRMVTAEIEEEILFREAVARGLLEHDGGVQTRLIQKMLFLESGAKIDEAPALLARAIELDLHREDVVVRRILVQKMRLILGRLDEDQRVSAHDVERRYASERDRLRAPDRITLSQVFVSRDRPGEPRERALALLDDLEASQATATDGPARGDPFPLGHHLAGRSRDDLDRTFGARFGDAVFAAAETPGRWRGPIESAYGFHLVRVEGVESGSVPALELVADRLRLEIEEERREANREALLSQIRARYEVRIPDAVAPDARRFEQENG